MAEKRIRVADLRKSVFSSFWHNKVHGAFAVKTFVNQEISHEKINKKIANLASLLSVTSACATSPSESDSASQQPAQAQIYVFESEANGFNTKTIFYDNGQEVVAIDAQFTPALAEEALDFLRQKSRTPLRYLLLTHPNPDKFNGISVFKKNGAQVIASRTTAQAMPGVHAYKKNFFVNVAGMFTEESYPTLDTVDITFEKNYVLKLKNGTSLELRELQGPGVSSNQTVVYIPQANALVVGDLVHHKAHAWLEGGIVKDAPKPTFPSWIKDLHEIATIFQKKNPTVYGGRGEAAKLNIVVPAQIHYLRRADEIVANYISTLQDRSELQSAKAGEHYTRIQNEFVAAFPEYTLDYMIQYGVYGLALSK